MVLLIAAGVGPQAMAAQSVSLDLLPASEALFQSETEGAKPNVNPEEGQVAVVGSFSPPAFEVEDINQVAVVDPDGNLLALQVDSELVMVEFSDRIVSLYFCFFVRAGDVKPGGTPFVVKWGPDVKAQNVSVDRLVLDERRRERYRSFRVRADGPGDAHTSTIIVIADSSAEYHFLWYLLPMALIFVLLTIRKIRARDSTNPASS